MASDVLGNAVTGGDAAAIAAVDDFVLGLLTYETRAVRVVEAAVAQPGHALLNVYAGFLHLLGESGNDAVNAAPYLAAAERAATGISERESALVAILRAWVADDLDAVVAGLDALLERHPRDLAALKLLHYHQFNRGRFAELLRSALRSATAAAEVPHVHGMVAFGYEQCHLLDDAERAARHALSLTEREPWAQHAIAHVMLTQARIDEGAAFLEAAAPLWTDLNSFMVTHLWWHLVLFYLSQGRDAEALAAYDAQVWAFQKDYSQDQIGAVSLLARFEVAGIDVGSRWHDVAVYLTKRARDTAQPFLAIQYLYGLARAGRPEADDLMAAIATTATEGPPHNRAAWRLAGVPLARGVLAHARGRCNEAVREIEAAMPHLIRIGGSHAQRDLFDQLLLTARIAAGELDAAQQQLELRRAHDPDGVALNRQLVCVYAGLHLPELAARARERVVRRLAALDLYGAGT